MRWTVVFAALAVLSCSGGTDDGEVCTSCLGPEDCPEGEFCVDSCCRLPPDQNGPCKTTSECLPDHICLSTGSCEKGECETSQDCLSPRTCVDFICWGTDCQDGESKPCQFDCHKGTVACDHGVWGKCSATPKVDEEICNNLMDDNCDGTVDEGCVVCDDADEPRECETPCGLGEETCVNGIWSECSTWEGCRCDELGKLEEVICGMCGSQTRTCIQSDWGGLKVSVWGDYTECEGQGECEAGVDEVGVCGNCGSQERLCGDNCLWGEWSACSGEGLCVPGQAKDKKCGLCGLQYAECGDDCQWDPWGGCQEDEGSCKLGEEDVEDCGNCGEKVRQCVGECVWGEWSECLDEGECAGGQKKSVPCQACGTQEVTCNGFCKWGSPTPCISTGVCEPGEVDSKDCGPGTDEGICQDGTMERTCTGQCQWNPWGECMGDEWPETEICADGEDQDCDGDDLIIADQYEPNQDCESCYWLGNDPDEVLYPTMHSVGYDSTSSAKYDPDDFFCFKGNDDIWSLPESIQVELIDQPVGMDGDLHLYKTLENCLNDDPIKSSMNIGGANEKISWGEAWGGPNDTAFYYVRVKNYSSTPNCYNSYTLKIKGLR